MYSYDYLTDKRVTVTLPDPIPRGMDCTIKYHDDDSYSTQSAFIAFVLPIHGDDEYLDVFGLDTISEFVYALDNGHDVFDPDNGSWCVILHEPISFYY